MKNLLLSLTVLFLMASCGVKEPQPIKLNTDSCDFCKMTIANSQYAAELITAKGRVYKFDDLSCMIQYAKENGTPANTRLFVNNYLEANQFIQAEQAFFLKGGNIHGPMGGKAVAFRSEAEAANYQTKLNAEPVSWALLFKVK